MKDKEKTAGLCWQSYFGGNMYYDDDYNESWLNKYGWIISTLISCAISGLTLTIVLLMKL